MKLIQTKIARLLVAIGVLAGASAVTANAQIIQNGNMTGGTYEQAGNPDITPPTDWVFFASNFPVSSIANTYTGVDNNHYPAGYSDSAYDYTDEAGPQGLEQTVTVAANTNYVLTARIDTQAYSSGDGNGTFSGAFGIGTDTTQGNSLAYQVLSASSTNTTDNFVLYTLDFNSGANTSLVVYTENNGSVEEDFNETGLAINPVVAAPEPSTYALLLGGGFGLRFLGRRKHASSLPI